MTVGERVLQYLEANRHKPAWVPEINAAIGATISATYEAIATLRRHSKIHTIKHKATSVYFLTSADADVFGREAVVREIDRLIAARGAKSGATHRAKRDAKRSAELPSLAKYRVAKVRPSVAPPVTGTTRWARPDGEADYSRARFVSMPAPIDTRFTVGPDETPAAIFSATRPGIDPMTGAAWPSRVA